MMIMVALASMLATTYADTAASAQRAAFSTCLKEAIANAKSANVGLEAFNAFAKTQCAAQEAALRKAVMALDMKNGISRKDATDNADFEMNDYFVTTAERYQAEVGAMKPKPDQAQAQAQAPEAPQPQQ